MIRPRNRLLALAATLALGACASAPLHYHTLVAPAAEPAVGRVSPSLAFELLPVSVPAQVDQPQLVVRQGRQGVLLLGSERWIAPLSDEVRSALSADLARDLQSQDVSGLPDSGGKPVLRIKLDLRRFDSQPGDYALIEGSWSVRVLHATPERALACSSRVREAVGPGYDALVQGHQRAIATLAAQIVAVARSLANAEMPLCPLP
ncbi:MAG: PqiC family protein [Rhodanobacter sp.]|jgi:uncharacterized lipoprotein YmbA|nr:PqiC family protein [Rhodanobacter sp.]